MATVDDPTAARTKQESSTGASANSPADARPPAKRSRKAINCEPCRASKLKCDRARPCSSCVLRGTASSCYQDARGEDTRPDDVFANRIDPHHEIARMRQSLATLEAHLLRGGPLPPPPALPQASPSAPAVTRAESPETIPKREPDADILPEQSVPGMLVRQGQGGFYAGSTSTATHLLSFKSANDPRDGDESGDRSSDDQSRSDYSPEIQRGFDQDLINELPPLHIIDGLVDYYFEYCNWIYRHVNPAAFSVAWTRYRSGASGDRLVLATLCVIMALASRYLPARHALLASLASTHEELGERYYTLAKQALSRYKAESQTLSLELVELLLIRTHYLTLSKNESEEIWSIRGELSSIGTAMGLHRDPDKWRMPRELAERRRWAWWHIILLERWQCFLFGRPLSIASHHFDTHMPSPSADPVQDPNGRIFLPNIHLFRLAYILGDIVDDAVSVKAIPYECVQDRDRALVKWMANLPKELDLDEYRVARSLASPIPSVMRLGVQSVIIRTSYYHIRFTLHRPYAAAAHGPHGNTVTGKAGAHSPDMDERMAQSLDTAVSAADKLIQLVGQARPDFFANASLAAPGHVHWGPFHCFSAAMFFSFQLIANPSQPGANLFRANIRRALDILNLSRGVAIADKAADILQALGPLYETGGDAAMDPEERDRKKRKVLLLVRTLAFPYHDSPSHTRPAMDGSPGAGRRAAESPAHVATSPSSAIPGLQHAHHHVPQQQQQPQHMQAQEVTSPATSRAPSQIPQPMYSHPPPPPPSQHMGALGQEQPLDSPPPQGIPHHQHPMPRHPHPSANPYGATAHQPQQHHPQPHPQPLPPHPQPQQPYPPIQQHVYNENARPVLYSQASSEEAMWGASVGFHQGDWARILDVMQRPDERMAPPVNMGV